MFRLEKYYPPGFDPQQHWDTRYAQAHIAGKTGDEFRQQGFWPLLAKQLVQSGEYLDVGCGIGGWVLFLAEEGYNIQGIDRAPRVIRALAEYNPDLRLKVGEPGQLPYADGSFDGVLGVGMLEYLDGEVPKALSELNRVLRDDGFVFIEVPIMNTLRRWFYIPLKRLQKMIYSALGKQATFANYLFDRRQLKRLIRQAGFEIVDEAPHELPQPGSHYGLWIDFKFLRGKEPYQLNVLGMTVKTIANMLSPWIASTGTVIVARKK